MTILRNLGNEKALVLGEGKKKEEEEGPREMNLKEYRDAGDTVGIRGRLTEPPMSPHPPAPRDQRQRPGAESIPAVVTVTEPGISPGRGSGWPDGGDPAPPSLPGGENQNQKLASLHVLAAQGGAGEGARPGAGLRAELMAAWSLGVPPAQPGPGQLT